MCCSNTKTASAEGRSRGFLDILVRSLAISFSNRARMPCTNNNPPTPWGQGVLDQLFLLDIEDGGMAGRPGNEKYFNSWSLLLPSGASPPSLEVPILVLKKSMKERMVKKSSFLHKFSRLSVLRRRFFTVFSPRTGDRRLSNFIEC